MKITKHLPNNKKNINITNFTVETYQNHLNNIMK